MWTEAQELRALMKRRNSSYWTTDNRQLWNTLQSVLGKLAMRKWMYIWQVSLQHISPDKVNSMPLGISSTMLCKIPFQNSSMLEQFSPMTIEKVNKLIVSALRRTCHLELVLAKDTKTMICCVTSH